jgi:Protein of unknown function (DUF3710)
MFRRRKDVVDPVTAEDEGTEDRTGPRARGPWDVSELDIPEDDQSRVDLGSLLLTPRDTLDVQLQVDEASGQVAAVIMAGEEGAVELRAFAAPRNADIWDDLRRQVAGEVARLGGTATETEGPWGTELRVALTVALDDGQHAQQTSRVVGIPGPRWLLRATMFGRPAVEYDPDGDVEGALRDVVVVRGGTPIPPGDPLPLTIPPSAQRPPSEQ